MNTSKLISKLSNGFKHQSVLNRLAASNNYLDLTNNEAISYNWWSYYKTIDGVRVFNVYRYSNTTAMHQSKMRRLLHKLGLSIDIEVNDKRSLSTMSIQDVYQSKLQERNVVFHKLQKCKRATSFKKSNLESQLSTIDSDINYLLENKILSKVG
jgi:hypothetical protein